MEFLLNEWALQVRKNTLALDLANQPRLQNPRDRNLSIAWYQEAQEANCEAHRLTWVRWDDYHNALGRQVRLSKGAVVYAPPAAKQLFDTRRLEFVVGNTGVQMFVRRVTTARWPQQVSCARSISTRSLWPTWLGHVEEALFALSAIRQNFARQALTRRLFFYSAHFLL